jgi:hypothetical protein
VNEKSDFVIKSPDDKDGIYELSTDGIKFSSINDSSIFLIGNPETFISFSEIKSINLSKNEPIYLGKEPLDTKNEIYLEIQLSEKGTSEFYTLTLNNLGKQLLIVIDNKAIEAPFLNVEIDNGKFPLIITEKDFNELIIKQ